MWLLTQPRGETFTRSQILLSAPGVNDKGPDRVILKRLIELRIIRTIESRSDLRLAALPAHLPSTVKRHASWSDNESGGPG